MTEKKVQKRTIESREKINRAAWQLFCEKGYFNTNTKEIAKNAGVSVGNFYNYYKDKIDVYTELTEQYRHGAVEAIEQLEELFREGADTRKILTEYICSQMNRATSTGRFFSDCQVLVQDNEKLRDLLEEDTQNIIHAIEQLLTRTPGVKKRASYPVMARVLFTMVDKISEDICSTTNEAVYQEYQGQLIELVELYLFE